MRINPCRLQLKPHPKPNADHPPHSPRPNQRQPIPSPSSRQQRTSRPTSRGIRARIHIRREIPQHVPARIILANHVPTLRHKHMSAYHPLYLPSPRAQYPPSQKGRPKKKRKEKKGKSYAPSRNTPFPVTELPPAPRTRDGLPNQLGEMARVLTEVPTGEIVLRRLVAPCLDRRRRVRVALGQILPVWSALEEREKKNLRSANPFPPATCRKNPFWAPRNGEGLCRKDKPPSRGW